MRQKTTRTILAAAAACYMLASCAGAPKAPETILSPAELAAQGRSTGGELLAWRELGSIRAKRVERIFSVAVPVVSTQIEMTNLDSIGYTEWRKQREGDLHDVRQIKIAFVSSRPEGGVEQQSGLLLLPELKPGDSRRLSWVVLMKGTEFDGGKIPTRERFAELPVAVSLAVLGYAVWVPDYAGMGDGEGVQEYCVPDSLANSGLEGLAAARSWLAMRREAGLECYEETGRLAIMGYSEGGLGAMACLDSLTRGRLQTPGLELSVVYPMGAPLNLQTIAPKGGTGPIVLEHPEYVVYLVMGWSRAYPGEIRMEDILTPRTIEKIVPLFDGTRSGDKVRSSIARTLGKRKSEVTDADLFTPEFLKGLREAPETIPYCRVQLEKRLDQFTPPPDLPIILAATPSDEIVSFENSANEAAWAREHAPDSELRLVELRGKDHLLGGVEALLYAIADFDQREASASR